MVRARLSRIIGAVLLGVGAVFQRKVRPEDHWSATPKIEVLDMIEDADAPGDPPSSDDRTTLPATA